VAWPGAVTSTSSSVKSGATNVGRDLPGTGPAQSIRSWARSSSYAPTPERRPSSTPGWRAPEGGEGPERSSGSSADGADAHAPVRRAGRAAGVARAASSSRPARAGRSQGSSPAWSAPRVGGARAASPQLPFSLRTCTDTAGCATQELGGARNRPPGRPRRGRRAAAVPCHNVMRSEESWRTVKGRRWGHDGNHRDTAPLADHRRVHRLRRALAEAVLAAGDAVFDRSQARHTLADLAARPAAMTARWTSPTTPRCAPPSPGRRHGRRRRARQQCRPRPGRRAGGADRRRVPPGAGDQPVRRAGRDPRSCHTAGAWPAHRADELDGRGERQPGARGVRHVEVRAGGASRRWRGRWRRSASA
jgi:hypothetical protein